MALSRIRAGVKTSVLLILFAAPLLYGQGVQCISGFVPRQAYPGDKVCVTVAVRAQVVADNRAAASRRASPNSDTCIAGYVWRQANPNDHVCVSPKTRAETVESNRMSSTRIVADSTQLLRVDLDGESIRGFRVSSNPPRQIASNQRLPHQIPPPLSNEQLRDLVRGLGIRVGSVVPVTASPGVSSSAATPGAIGNAIEYILTAAQNGVLGMFKTTSPQYMSIDGAQGFIEIDFAAVPGKQYLLDCSIDSADTTLEAQSGYYLSSGFGAGLTGNPTRSNGHLLVPLNPAPPNTQEAFVQLFFQDQIGLFGCQVHTISQ